MSDWTRARALDESADLVRIAKLGYRHGIALVIAQLQNLADQLEPAIGEVSGGEAALAWRRAAIDLLEGRRLPKEA